MPILSGFIVYTLSFEHLFLDACPGWRGFRAEIVINLFGYPSTKDISFVVHHPSAIRILVGKHTKSHRTVGKQQDAGVRPGIAERPRLVGYLDCLRQEAC